MNENHSKSDILKSATISLCVALYVISLTQSAFSYDDFDGLKNHSSISLLLMGGLAILGGGLFEWLIWIANPLFILAVILLIKNNKLSIALGISSSIIGLIFRSWKEILAAENGRTAEIASFDAGYYLWITSFIIFTIGSILFFKLDNNLKRENTTHNIS